MLTDGFWTFSLAAFVVKGSATRKPAIWKYFGSFSWFWGHWARNIFQSFYANANQKATNYKKYICFNNKSNPESLDDCNIYWKPQASKHCTAVIYEWFHFLLLKYSIKIKHTVFFIWEIFLKGKIILVPLSKTHCLTEACSWWNWSLMKQT